MKYFKTLSFCVFLVVLDISYCKNEDNHKLPVTEKNMKEHFDISSHQLEATTENMKGNQPELLSPTTSSDQQSPISKNIINLVIRRLLREFKSGRVKITKSLNEAGNQTQAQRENSIKEIISNHLTVGQENIRKKRSPHGKCRKCGCGGGWCGGGGGGGGYIPQWQYAPQPQRTCYSCGGGYQQQPQYSYSQSSASASSASFSGR